nr:hypothetical protein Iba_chr08bCG5490 [Ipomoea batatas]GMD24827.1 hypothetical protein Iba_chr08cCG4300 [Ipomoea batatas]GME19689.1 hypothetical protein Iba_scaffold23510CG0010 [Ipomoea batatas]
MERCRIGGRHALPTKYTRFTTEPRKSGKIRRHRIDNFTPADLNWLAGCFGEFDVAVIKSRETNIPCEKTIGR